MNALKAAKQRLSEAAAKCLAGDRQAAVEADAAMAEVRQLLAESTGTPLGDSETVREPFPNGVEAGVAEATATVREVKVS